MAKYERKYLAHYIDVNFNTGTPSYVRIGKDLEEYNIELNPQIETTKNIWGETSVNHGGYEVSSDVDTYYAYSDDPLFKRLAEIVNERKTGSALETTIVDVLVDESGNVEWAYQEQVIVSPTSLGGDTSGVQIPFTINNNGSRVKGEWDIESKTFTKAA